METSVTVRPSYEDTAAGITIYCGDCLTVLPQLPAGTIVDDAWDASWFDDPEEFREAAAYQWTDGNFGCDRNRSLVIQEPCDAAFPDLACGETITLITLETEP